MRTPKDMRRTRVWLLVAAGAVALACGSSGSGAGAFDSGTAGVSGQAGTGSGGSADAGSSGSDGTAGSSGTEGGAGGSGGSDADGGTSAGGTAGADAGGSAGADAGSNAGGSSGASGSAGAGGSSDAGGSAGTSGGTAGSGGSTPCNSASECDDDAYCTGVEDCVAGFCAAGTPVTCADEDGIACTVEVCNESADACVSVPQSDICSDDLFCTGVEKCLPEDVAADATTGCVAGTPPTCDDGATCTDDACDEDANECSFEAFDERCDDAIFCNGGETCDPTDSGADGSSGCVSGDANACDDGVDCTEDSCNEDQARCDNEPNDVSCQNGQSCDGAETCDPIQGCINENPTECAEDAFACTVEGCNEFTGDCETTIDLSQCEPGEFCEPESGCVTGAACDTNPECDDGNPCNGTEFCDLNLAEPVCKPGVQPPACDDGIDCTFDRCCADGVGCTLGACVFTSYDSICDDQDLCTGIEACDPENPNADDNTGCVSGTLLDCSDDIGCTDDSCSALSGCKHVINSDNCNDGIACNGAEICSPDDLAAQALSGCVAGSPPECADDGIDCTTEICTEAANGCTSVPNNDACDCGETCSPTQGGCGNFCTLRKCDGHVYECGDCIDNDNDCGIDSGDEHCLGACQNSEACYKGEIPGQSNAPCKADCYFDANSGSGNDECYWSHECDILQVGPAYDPEGKKCEYEGTPGVLPPDSDAQLEGTSMSCAEAYVSQSSTCEDYCGPLTPNGCDCFGCCLFPGETQAVWLNTEGVDGNNCALDDFRPCTQVIACLNTCETCEICVGKPELPPECDIQDCPVDETPCGQPGQAACPNNEYCVTGCCAPVAN